jgi:hypothetical protein
MKSLFFSLCVLVVLATGCNRATKIEISDTVTVQLSEKHKQICGTKLFMVFPDGFKANANRARLEKNDSTFVYAVVYADQDYSEMRQKIILKTEGASISYRKEFQLNGYKAYLVCGNDEDSQQGNAILLFGDETLTALVGCQFPAGDKVLEAELVNALCTVYYKEEVKEDPIALRMYSLDLSGSDFHYSFYNANTFFYARNNADSLKKPQTQFAIVNLPVFEKKLSYGDLRDMGYEMVKNSLGTNINVSELRDDPVRFGNIEGCEIRFKGNFRYDGYLEGYACVIANERISVQCIGLAFEKQWETIDEIKKIMRTLKIRE